MNHEIKILNRAVLATTKLLESRVIYRKYTQLLATRVPLCNFWFLGKKRLPVNIGAAPTLEWPLERTKPSMVLVPPFPIEVPRRED